MTEDDAKAGRISFVRQTAPIDERGRAMYAVTRSIIRALVDQLSIQDLTDLNTERVDITLRQLSVAARLQRDKGMRGDGFEWAIHEAIRGQEPTVVEPILHAMKMASPKSFKGTAVPQSLLFGYERAKYLGFLDAVVGDAAEAAVILPDTRGRPPTFGNWVPVAAQGKAAEPVLGARLLKVWKTDLFLSDEARHRHVAATIKSNAEQLEAGPGLRIGIVPEAHNLPRGVSYHWNKTRTDGLWVVTLADPNGFMGLYNDAYGAVAEAIATLGRHERGNYWSKPSPMGVRIQQQLESYGTRKVVDIEDGLNEAAQQDLVGVEERLVPVDAPPWLHLGKPKQPMILAPKPSFIKLD
ncbi:hypothetical protein AB0F90_01500 [Micromonospora chalcea]|uniref:hypothetical protein n=1 Tax=Micromonospora chalcea TaxID=1874 RepID=UPI003401A9C8